MISKVRIRNFKSLRDVRIELERFTVFVGPNGSGKSSVLEVLDLLCRIFRQGDFDDRHIAPRWLSRGLEAVIEVSAESGERSFRYRSRTPSESNGVPLGLPGGIGPMREIASGLDSVDWKICDASIASLPPSIWLRLETSKLTIASVASPDPAVMGSDGTGMHAALASMALHDPDSWQALQADLNRIIPSIRRLRHTKVPLGQIPSLLFDTLGADSLPATQVSEGTLLVLGLLTVLYGPDRPSLVLLDDLDRGLHPRAQKDLVTLLRGLLDTNPELQIVATTHSPYLLEWMQAKEVRMTWLQEGSMVCAPLEEHPKFEKWKDEMSPGEMWSLFGEKWLAEKAGAIA